MRNSFIFYLFFSIICESRNRQVLDDSVCGRNETSAKKSGQIWCGGTWKIRYSEVAVLRRANGSTVWCLTERRGIAVKVLKEQCEAIWQSSELTLSLAARWESVLSRQNLLTFHSLGSVLLPPRHAVVVYGTSPVRGGRLLRSKSVLEAGRSQSASRCRPSIQ